jgi:hypothetical protein
VLEEESDNTLSKKKNEVDREEKRGRQHGVFEYYCESY